MSVAAHRRTRRFSMSVEIMQPSHQTFLPVPAVKLGRLCSQMDLSFFHIITAGDVDGCCPKWLV